MSTFPEDMETVPNATCERLLDGDGDYCGRRVTGWTIGRIDGEIVLVTACPAHSDESTTELAHLLGLPTGDRLDGLVNDALWKEQA